MVNTILLGSSFDSALHDFWQLRCVLVIFVFVLAITYVATKWIAGYQKVQMAGKNLKVVETMRIANNKYIQLIKVADDYLLIAVGKDEVTMLAKLEDGRIPDIPEDRTSVPIKESFQEILEKFGKHTSGKKK